MFCFSRKQGTPESTGCGSLHMQIAITWGYIQFSKTQTHTHTYHFVGYKPVILFYLVTIIIWLGRLLALVGFRFPYFLVMYHCLLNWQLFFGCIFHYPTHPRFQISVGSMSSSPPYFHMIQRHERVIKFIQYPIVMTQVHIS